MKRVQRVNKKLSGFEGGFISSGGIVDREWYKHLGVAPGKWLGCVFHHYTSTSCLNMCLQLRCYNFARANRSLDDREECHACQTRGGEVDPLGEGTEQVDYRLVKHVVYFLNTNFLSVN